MRSTRFAGFVLMLSCCGCDYSAPLEDNEPNYLRQVFAEYESRPKGLGVFAHDFAVDTRGVDADGEPFALQQLQGKIVVLAFLDGSTPFGEKLFPVVQDWKRKYRGLPFEVVTVHEDSVEHLQELRDAHQIRWPTVLNETEEGYLSELWCIELFPTLVLIDQDGTIVDRRIGFSEEVTKNLPLELMQRLVTGEQLASGPPK